jgi:hypothetical protein
MKKYEALEAAIAALKTMRALSPNNYEYYGEIIEGLIKLRQQDPEITTLDKLIEKQTTSFRGGKKYNDNDC